MKHETDNDHGPATAAEWFVTLESDTNDQDTEREFEAWLERDAENERALERCEAAVQAVAELEQDPDLKWAFAEIDSIGDPVARTAPHADTVGWRSKAGFAWIAATVVGVGVVAVLLALQVARQPVLDGLPTQGELLGDSLRPGALPDPTITIPTAALPNSIAVLPFEALGPQPDTAIFASGLYEMTLNRLAGIRNLNVVTRASVMRYAGATAPLADIARDLNVRTVVEGIVSYDDNSVRVSAQLVDATTGAHLWSASYDRQFENIFEVQSAISQSIAAAVAERAAVDPESAEEAVMTSSTQKALVWVDFDGREETLPFPALPYTSVRLSPDGRRIAVTTTQEDGDELWVLDLVRQTASRLSFGGPPVRSPVWSPEGQQIVFGSEGVGGGLIFALADGSGLPVRFVESEAGEGYWPSAISSDGQSVVYSIESDQGMDLFLAPMTTLMTSGSAEAAAPLIAGPSNETQATLSPDGRWLAYVADDLGRSEIYVRPFPDVGAGRWQVSVDGGTEPLWAPDGERIYFRRNGRINAVDVETSPTFSVGWSGPVFFGNYASTPFGASYDISPDGQRFLVLRDVSSAPEDGRLRSLGYL